MALNVMPPMTIVAGGGGRFEVLDIGTSVHAQNVRLDRLLSWKLMLFNDGLVLVATHAGLGEIVVIHCGPRVIGRINLMMAMTRNAARGLTGGPFD